MQFVIKMLVRTQLNPLKEGAGSNSRLKRYNINKDKTLAINILLTNNVL